jgi:hypothetical protein
MTPVDQRIIDPDRGDCMTACLASLLDLPYEDVPYFLEEGAEPWFTVYWRFLKQHGYDFVGTCSNSGEAIDFEDLVQRCAGVNGFYMAGGPSPRFNCSHAVIINSRGEIVHDPHPSRAGVLKIDHVDMIRPLTAAGQTWFDPATGKRS